MVDQYSSATVNTSLITAANTTTTNDGDGRIMKSNNRTKKMKSLLLRKIEKIGRQGRLRMHNQLYSSSDEKDLCIIEYSLDKHQQQVSKESKQQQRHRRQQSRDDDDEIVLLPPQEVQRTIEDRVENDDTNSFREVEESLFSYPLNWIYSFQNNLGDADNSKKADTDFREETEDNDDAGGYEADQEREQHVLAVVDFDNVKVVANEAKDNNRMKGGKTQWMKNIVKKKRSSFSRKNRKNKKIVAEEKKVVKVSAANVCTTNTSTSFLGGGGKGGSLGPLEVGSVAFEATMSTFVCDPETGKPIRRSLHNKVARSPRAMIESAKIASQHNVTTQSRVLFQQGKEVSKKSGAMASKSSKAITSSAKKASQVSSELAARSTKAIVDSKSSKAIVSSAKKASKVSGELAARSSKVIATSSKKASQKSGEFASRSSKVITTSARKASKTSGELACRSRRAVAKSTKKASQSFMNSAQTASKKSAKKKVSKSSSGERASRRSSSSRSMIHSAKKASQSTAVIASKYSRNSSKVIARGAKKATKSSCELASRSSRVVVKSAKEVTAASKALIATVKRLIDTNQKAAASRLVHAVHEMIQRYQRSSVYQSPGDILGQVNALIQNTETTLAKNRRTACRDRRQQYRERKLIEYNVNTDLAESKLVTATQPATQVYDLINAKDITYYSSDDIDDDDESYHKEMLSKSDVFDFSYDEEGDVDDDDDDDDDDVDDDDDNDDKYDEGDDDDDDDDDDHTRVDNSTDFDIDSASDSDSDSDAVTVLHEMIHHAKVDEYELELFKDEDEDEDEDEDDTYNDTDIDWENQDSTTSIGSGGYSSTYTSGVSYGASSAGYNTVTESEFETTDFDTDGCDDTHGEGTTDDELVIYSPLFQGQQTDYLVEYDTDGNTAYDTDGNTDTCQTFDINTDKEDDDDDDDTIIKANLSQQDKSILMAIEVELEELKGMHEQEKKGWLYSTFFS